MSEREWTYALLLPLALSALDLKVFDRPLAVNPHRSKVFSDLATRFNLAFNFFVAVFCKFFGFRIRFVVLNFLDVLHVNF